MIMYKIIEYYFLLGIPNLPASYSFSASTISFSLAGSGLLFILLRSSGVYTPLMYMSKKEYNTSKSRGNNPTTIPATRTSISTGSVSKTSFKIIFFNFFSC